MYIQIEIFGVQRCRALAIIMAQTMRPVSKMFRLDPAENWMM